MTSHRKDSSRPKRFIVPGNTGSGTLVVSAISKDRIVLTHRASNGRSSSLCELNVEKALALQFALHNAIQSVEEPS